jgi:hypothetical protein
MKKVLGKQKTKYVAARLSEDLYNRLTAALIREQSRQGCRLTASGIIAESLKNFVERSEKAR